MKKILLAFSATAIAFSSAFAQLPNNGFETWGPDTSILDLTQLGQGIDTFYFQDPADWTTSNFITGASFFGNKIFATESSTANTGNSAISLQTDTVFVSLLGQYMPIPGFVASGAFEVSLTSFVSSSISLTNIPGAGVPVDGRKGKLKGFYNYTPGTLNKYGLPSSDSCAAIAVLKKGGTIVATATFFASAATSGYQAFEAPFVYSSCEVPDSVIVLLSASDPRSLEGLMDGATDSLPIGSVVLFDDISLEDTVAGFEVGPFAFTDSATTLKNNAVTVTVTANDQECYGNALTVSAGATSAAGGTLSVNGSDVEYTPATDFTGADSFNYTITSTVGSSTAKVYVTVNSGTGIYSVDNIAAAIYPNPAQNVLNIEVDAKEVSQVVITDVVGKVVAAKAISTDKTTIATDAIQNGLYVINLLDASGKVKHASKLIVTK